ncbi:MAG: 3'-5' exoribonuclease [Microscillaceae bacterium]|nr:3'-5' exoribonuclease [Microscillaceae bacterium]
MISSKKANIYLDTEFIFHPAGIELISLALVRDNGEAYYAISAEFHPEKADEWVKSQVLAQLRPEEPRKPLAQIKAELVAFVGYQIPAFWAYFATYDWFLVLQLFGGMAHLPCNFPSYCGELRQEADRLNLAEAQYPPNPKPHHAQWDAQWNRHLHQVLRSLEKENSPANTCN